jgi:hypothetical protein
MLTNIYPKEVRLLADKPQNQVKDQELGKTQWPLLAM